jgi:hypothetical protein
MLRDHGIEISMDGRGRSHDNICFDPAIPASAGFRASAPGVRGSWLLRLS